MKIIKMRNNINKERIFSKSMMTNDYRDIYD